MQIINLDRYKDIESFIHDLDPRVKLVVTILFILSTVLLPDGAWLAFGFSWLLVILVSMFSQLGIAYTFLRSFVALPFAMAAFTILFTLPGEPLTTFAIGPWELVVTDAGLLRFSSIVIRSWVSVQMAILLTATTPFPDLAHALRHLRIPPILITMISFMYRYLFVLSDEVLRLLRARSARSARIPGKKGSSVFWRARGAGNMAGQLFLRSYDRSDRIYNAMLARGYTGNILTITPHHMHSRDWVAGAVSILLLILLHLFTNYLMKG